MGVGENEGTIWKIDRYAVHDGPGIRTNLYFKGCHLRCQWCDNPEGQIAAPELSLSRSKCNNCGLCVKSCPRQAIRSQAWAGAGGAELRIDRSACDLCGACLPVCPTRALDILGRRYTPGQLADIVDRDKTLHRKSGGGVTCTGGDPLYQHEFTRELLKLCRHRGIHTALETCGYVEEEAFRAVLEQVDWLFLDLKHMNPEEHVRLTGKSNGPILRNLRLASSAAAAGPMVLAIRMVIVPGVNDGPNISHLADFLAALPRVTSVELIPYHSLGAYKYEQAGRFYDLTDTKPPATELSARYQEILKSRGLPAPF